MRLSSILLFMGVLSLSALPTQAFELNAHGIKLYTYETEHFSIHYMDGLDRTAFRTADILEDLYGIYRNTYRLTLPSKTNVLVIDNDQGDGWAMDVANTLLIAANGLDFTNLRGTHDYLRDVITHEYAHIVSITSSHRFSNKVPYAQIGYFTHPNENKRTEILAPIPNEILPPWLFEGIAQYESSLRGADSWDSHRDMILRTLSLSDKLLSWDHMYVFAGKGDDFEKTYNHGFSMVRYIAETYGFESIVSILRESTKATRFDLDGSIKSVLGIPARTLYANWKQWLATGYKKQVSGLGKQVYGKKINKDGYDNTYPQFTHDGKNILFLSNGKHDYSYFYRSLYRYDLSDTVKDDKKITLVTGGIKSAYNLTQSGNRITWASQKSDKSRLPMKRGGYQATDVFTDSFTLAKKKFNLFPKKTEKQVTLRGSVFHPAFSPDGRTIVGARHDRDRSYICLMDTGGKKIRTIYPDSTKADQAIQTIFSYSWAPDGHTIALSYIRGNSRDIALYDTLNKTFTPLFATASDERDPCFSPDGKSLYFSDDRTGIFNLYRYTFDSRTIDRITNVTGSAFSPHISPDGKKVVYVNYDPTGYGIYLLDSIQVLASSSIDSLPHDTTGNRVLAKVKGSRKTYSYIPKVALFIPTLIAEQTVTSNSNTYKGVTAVKLGTIFELIDPFALAGMSAGITTGNSIGGYLLIDPAKILKFIDVGRGLINPKVSFDLGFWGTTHMLPIDISAEYAMRSITGVDYFWDETNNKLIAEPYNVTPYNFNVKGSVYLAKGSGTSSTGVHAFVGLNRADVTLILDDIVGGQLTYQYNIRKGASVGALLSTASFVPEPTSNIAPRGLVAKMQYSLENQKLIKDENSFDASGHEVYNTYLYHDVKARAFLGFASPFFSKNVISFSAGTGISNLIQTPKGKINFPYYYEPQIYWHPGYAYYVDTIKVSILERSNGDTLIQQKYTRGTIAGNVIAYGSASYRFPLWPKSLDRKIGFLYLDRLYAGITGNVGAGWRDLKDLTQRPNNDLFRRQEWLTSIGGDIRLQALSFGKYPCDIQLSYQNGRDHPAPMGGDRIALTIGFGFDNFGPLESPEISPSAQLPLRMTPR